jgi:two-component system, cell cycle sensor histidine kinase and response regulator CckA
MTNEQIEQRLAELARSKARLELVNRQLTSLSTVTGLDNLLSHILDILMQTVGAANISIAFRLDNVWLHRDLFGTGRESNDLDNPGMLKALEIARPLRLKDPLKAVPYPGSGGEIEVENWFFPLLSNDHKIGVVCMEGMQLTTGNIFDELQPFFTYAGLMLDNEISNHSLLAEAHRRLQESETLYRTLFEQSPDGIVLWNLPELRMLQHNSAAHNMLGYSSEEFSCLTVNDIENSYSPDEVAENIAKLERFGELSLDTTLRTKDGKCRLVAVTLKLVEIGANRAILATHRDITQMKQAEEEQRRLEQQLLHAQKLESMGILAGGIAHDFNNILMAIIGNADLALMRINRESPVVENLNQIEKAAARAADLARQMLAYSGKGHFVVELIDLNTLLQEMLHILQVSISKKALLKLNLQQPLSPIEADATQIRQIVMNLVINASEAIGDQSGVIAVSTGCMECSQEYLKNVWLDENLSAGLYVYLEVVDTGCGMDSDTLSRLFDPFFTTKFTGRGLGMAAVLGIVRGHKGGIRVSSEPGRGTTFRVLFPAAGRPFDESRSESAVECWKGKGTVLLVDDEESVRSVGTAMLKELGFDVVTAADGIDALEILRNRGDIALVILDLTMPRMDGEQCFRELQKMNSSIKVIISSGYNELEVSRRFNGNGMVGFVQKPYRMSTLEDVVKSVLPKE